MPHQVSDRRRKQADRRRIAVERHGANASTALSLISLSVGTGQLGHRSASPDPPENRRLSLTVGRSSTLMMPLDEDCVARVVHGPLAVERTRLRRSRPPALEGELRPRKTAGSTGSGAVSRFLQEAAVGVVDERCIVACLETGPVYRQVGAEPWRD
jgi:hypothetical protein